MSSTRYCTFRLAHLTFGVEVERVREVLRFQPMSPVPLSSHVVEGLINLRGQVLTALCLRRRLGLPAREDGVRPMNVVVMTSDGPLALLVDAIGDVVEVDPDTYEEPPATLEGVARDLIVGVHKLESLLLLVLDTEKVVRLPDTAVV
jgi:purine-binding chemotaxis protein CheW